MHLPCCTKSPDPPDKNEDKEIVLSIPMGSLDKQLNDACVTMNITAIRQLLHNEIDRCEGECSLRNPYRKEYFTLLDYLLNNLSHNHHNTLFDIIKEGLSKENYEEAFGSLLTISAKEDYSIILNTILNRLKEQDECKIKYWLNRKDVNGQTVLISAIKEDEDTSRNESKSTKCIEILMEYRHHFNIDAQDDNGNTALHYAVQDDWTYGRTYVKTLIMNGACINIQNKEDICVMDRIPANTIEDILSSCIEEPNGSVDYRKTENYQVDNRKMENYQLKMDFRIFSHKESLDTKNESEFISALQDSRQHRHLLYHPLISTFLHIKWQKLKHLWYFNLLANVVFFLLIYFYMFYCRYDLIVFGTTDKNVNILTLKIVITVLGLILMMREIFQLKAIKWDYLSSFDNYLEVTILIMTWVMLYVEDVRTQQSTAAWLIVLIAFALLLLFEKMHLMKLSIFISMFRKVTFNFIKVVVLLLFMVLAFGISFFLLIHVTPKDDGKENMKRGNENEFESLPVLVDRESKNENRFAPSLKEALLKTLIMSTGEFDLSDLDFDFFPFSRLLFAVFVFSVFLVGMNLLNGIAISDIQIIQKYASRYYVLRNQIECIIFFDNAKSFFNYICFLNIWRKGQIFEKCFQNKIIGPIYPNKHYHSLYVYCSGHKESMFHFLKAFKWFGFHPKKIGECIRCKKTKSLRRCTGCGRAKTVCQICIDKNPGDEHIEHPCVYSHKFWIPQRFVTAAMQLKEEIERKEQDNENDNKLSKICDRMINIENDNKLSKISDRMINIENFLKDILQKQGNDSLN